MTDLGPKPTHIARPSLAAILWHRVTIWRAARLLDKANRCADKAVKLVPSLIGLGTELGTPSLHDAKREHLQ